VASSSQSVTTILGKGVLVAKPPIPANLVDMLKRPNPAVMGTVRADGTPVTVATWYLWDRGRILVNMDAGRKRLEHIRANPRISLTVLDGDAWYRHVSVQGSATLEPDDGMTDIDRIARHYTGKPYVNRWRARINAWLDIDAYHVWGFRSPAA
jgi:PPOX class probable F420-dependent enzyme